jgi:hypothetical protein
VHRCLLHVLLAAAHTASLSVPRNYRIECLAYSGALECTTLRLMYPGLYSVPCVTVVLALLCPVCLVPASLPLRRGWWRCVCTANDCGQHWPAC